MTEKGAEEQVLAMDRLRKKVTKTILWERRKRDPPAGGGPRGSALGRV